MVVRQTDKTTGGRGLSAWAVLVVLSALLLPICPPATAQDGPKPPDAAAEPDPPEDAVGRPDRIGRLVRITLPITGALVFLGALVAIIEDVVRYRKGEFQVAGGSGAG